MTIQPNNWVYEIVNPSNGSEVLMRCIDGRMKGRHLWLDKDAHSKVFASASWKKQYAGFHMKAPPIKQHVYYVKRFRWHENSYGHTVNKELYYLTTERGTIFDDVVSFFGPKSE